MLADSTDSDSLYEDAMEDPSTPNTSLKSSLTFEHFQEFLKLCKKINESKFEVSSIHDLSQSLLSSVANSKISENSFNILSELPNCIDAIKNFKNSLSVDEISPIKVPFDKCGVTFTRSDYFMIPDFAKIHKFRTNNNQCVIDGLTIGRLGYGNIYFREPVDIFGINIDAVLFITHKMLSIYPDSDKMPRKGTGLNVPCQITLDRVFPTNNEKEDITSPFGETLIKFKEKLKKVCERMGTEFIDYRPETGSWVFTVEHF